MTGLRFGSSAFGKMRNALSAAIIPSPLWPVAAKTGSAPAMDQIVPFKDGLSSLAIQSDFTLACGADRLVGNISPFW